jgi:hypothetical protein
MANEQQRNTFSHAPLGGYRAGQRSITKRQGVSRFEIMRRRELAALRNRPFVIGALIFVILVMAIPAYGFYLRYVVPPTEVAVKVEDKTYTRGDIVNYIRFFQRLSEDLGVPFELGTSAFEAMQTLQSNELAYHLAPRYGITVEQHEVDDQLEALLGFVADVSAESSMQEHRSNVEEAKKQFLNRVGLDEEVYRDFIRKGMFKDRLRDEVASNLSRIQPHTEVYQIVLQDVSQSTINRIERDLASGRDVSAVVLELSEDPMVKRTGGYVGWLPQGVRTDLDSILFGHHKNEDGSEGDRILPLNTLSGGRYDDTTQLWTAHIVSDFVEAREIDDEHFDVLANLAVDRFINEHREDFDTSVSLNSEVYDWINRQVRLNAIVPTATPESAFASLEDLNNPSRGR